MIQPRSYSLLCAATLCVIPADFTATQVPVSLCLLAISIISLTALCVSFQNTHRTLLHHYETTKANMDDSNNLEFLQEFHHSDYYIDLDDKVFKPRSGVVLLNTVRGTNRVLLRHVVLSLKFDGAEYLREEEKSSVLIQVTEYLCPIWHTNFAEHINVTFKNHNGFIQDLGAFNKVFRFLQLGSMNVNKYHQLVNEVYIKGDGSGGTISWGPQPRDGSIFLPAVYCDSVEFLTTDSGLRLLPQRPEQALKLMTLPSDVQYKTYGMVLQEVKIDADKTASPIPPLCYVNQELLHSKDSYLRDVKLLDITTTTIFASLYETCSNIS